MRKLVTVVLGLAIALWAEAGLAVVQGDQPLQCSMSAHEMQELGDTPCCPDEEMQAPAKVHPQCCSPSQRPERPLGFVVSSAKNKVPGLEVAAELHAGSAAPAAHRSAAWQNDNSPQFVKPVLELKTDLRI